MLAWLFDECREVFDLTEYPRSLDKETIETLHNTQIELTGIEKYCIVIMDARQSICPSVQS